MRILLIYDEAARRIEQAEQLDSTVLTNEPDGRRAPATLALRGVNVLA